MITEPNFLATNIDQPGSYSFLALGIFLVVFNLYQFIQRSDNSQPTDFQSTDKQERCYSGRALMANPPGYLTLLAYPPNQAELDREQLVDLHLLLKECGFSIETDPDLDEYIIFTIPEYNYDHVIKFPVLKNLEVEILDDNLPPPSPTHSDFTISSTEEDSFDDQSYSEDIDY